MIIAKTSPIRLYTKELDEYTAEALDRLWWIRIAELIKDRDDAQKEITSRKTRFGGGFRSGI